MLAPWAQFDLALVYSAVAEYYGGLPTYVLNLIPYLRQHARVQLVTGVSVRPRPTPDFLAVTREGNIPVVTFKTVPWHSKVLTYFLGLYAAKRMRLSAHDIRVLLSLLSARHLHHSLCRTAIVEVKYPTEAVISLLLPRRVKTIVHPHQVDVSVGFQRLQPLLLPRIDRVVTCSHWTRERLKPYFPGKRIEVLYNGVDVARFRPLQEPDLSRLPFYKPYRSGSFKIGMVGRLERAKGLDVILNLAVEIGEALDCEFFLVGPVGGIPASENSARIETMRRGYASLHRVHILGPMPNGDLPHFYNFLDCFVLPSRAENFPMVVLEAMACGCLTVATDVGGTSELISPGVDGFLVPPVEAEIGNILRTLASQRENPRWRQVGQQAREKTVAQFAWEHIAAQVVSIYRDVLNGNGASSGGMTGTSR